MASKEFVQVNPKELETERLRLRLWSEAYFAGFAGMYSDEEQARFIGGRLERPQAWRLMAALAGHWTLRGYGPWAVVEKSSGEFLGSIGLWYPEGWLELELGYWLLPEARGTGYATEAGAAARDFAFEAVGAQTLVSYIHPENVPSRRLAERLGARYEETIELLNHGPHCVYRYPHSQDVRCSERGE